ncbi:type VII toxin-antitoxin system MntA family adenylyltransferase antitoxin [Salinigranum sp. GCM10025319]|uniref:type VII toxin-antitoxin system MntA family adenylyltransferase antitoxin n=1 Tax=Salinigranum sp. GCM10025319 TaxID=3252687 RepID=UPI00361688A7
MDTSAERSQILAALAESVCSDPDVVFAVAFGSWITGDPTPSSDVDLAVKFGDVLSERERFEKRCFLSGDLQRDDRPFIDVSDIESLPLDVAHDAVNGELLCGDERAFERFTTEIEDEFDEQRETLRRRQRAVIDRIAEDGLRG